MSRPPFIKKLVKPLVLIAMFFALAVVAYLTQGRWKPLMHHDDRSLSADMTGSHDSESVDENETILLTDQAIANLDLRAASTVPETYWKSIQVPGMVVDLPGRSDRGVITPVTGVVTTIHRFPGDTVQPGEVLFTVRLLSESLHATQTELFRATQDIALAEAQRKRLESAGEAIPRSRIVEVENQLTRLRIAVLAFRKELQVRGLTLQQIDHTAEGNFVSEIAVLVPDVPPNIEPLTTGPLPNQEPSSLSESASAMEDVNGAKLFYEIQELNVGVGNQVQAGETLCTMANHQSLAIEGSAFRDETALLERSVHQNWPVEVDFQENASSDWPASNQAFFIRNISNTIDAKNRTFSFLIPLTNQSRIVDVEGATQMLWRYRPGQRVRVLVRVERLDNVFVLPRAAVTRDVADSFVFTQNVNTFERRPVRVLAEDRHLTVVANDGSILPGSFVVQNAADQLNRMTKSKSGNGLPEGYHIHADGSLHKNEDE